MATVAADRLAAAPPERDFCIRRSAHGIRRSGGPVPCGTHSAPESRGTLLRTGLLQDGGSRGARRRIGSRSHRPRSRLSPGRPSGTEPTPTWRRIPGRALDASANRRVRAGGTGPASSRGFSSHSASRRRVRAAVRRPTHGRRPRHRDGKPSGSTCTNGPRLRVRSRSLASLVGRARPRPKDRVVDRRFERRSDEHSTARLARTRPPHSLLAAAARDRRPQELSRSAVSLPEVVVGAPPTRPLTRKVREQTQPRDSF